MKQHGDLNLIEDWIARRDWWLYFLLLIHSIAFVLQASCQTKIDLNPADYSYRWIVEMEKNCRRSMVVQSREWQFYRESGAGHKSGGVGCWGCLPGRPLSLYKVRIQSVALIHYAQRCRWVWLGKIFRWYVLKLVWSWWEKSKGGGAKNK